VPVGQAEPLEELVSGSIANFRAAIRVFISFAAAILPSAIGIYGLVSYCVSQRSYEIGLRMAIGATRHRIISMIPAARSARCALLRRRHRSLDFRSRHDAGADSRHCGDCRAGLARLADRPHQVPAGGLGHFLLTICPL